MKLLLIQLSDMHCKDSDINLTEKISRAIDALSTLGCVDKAVLVFSGDLTNTASRIQFKVGKAMLGKFLSGLGKKLGCGFINTFIVPGNHDMILSENARTANDIKNGIKTTILMRS